MPYQIDFRTPVSAVIAQLSSPTTRNGLLSAAVAIMVGIYAVPPGSRWIAYALAALRALQGFYQSDATKPVDDQGKPVPSTEVPVAK